MSNCCPKCKSKVDLIRRITLILYPTNWPLAICFALVVAWFGVVLALPQNQITLFTLLGIIPVIAEIKSRICCERCNINLPDEVKAEAKVRR